MKRFIAGCIVAGLVASAQAEWKAAESPLMTRWGKGVTPENAWRSYPRPQMVRDDWMNLNGLWQYGITEKDAAAPSEWTGEILVPFAVEAPLSGVGRKLQPTEALWYKRNLELADPAGRRVLLHFEAVDYASKVWVNGQEAGGHIGGNLPFSFDVTELMSAAPTSSGESRFSITMASGIRRFRGSGRRSGWNVFRRIISAV
jgi:beta-galactosidase